MAVEDTAKRKVKRGPVKPPPEKKGEVGTMTKLMMKGGKPKAGKLRTKRIP